MTTPSLAITTALFMLCFAALGAGNGATFQLVPLRWPLTTAVAGGMIGEIGAIGGSILPNLLGQSKQHTGSFRAGWICYASLAFLVLIVMRIVARRWTKTWVGKGGRALESQPTLLRKWPRIEVKTLSQPIRRSGLRMTNQKLSIIQTLLPLVIPAIASSR